MVFLQVPAHLGSPGQPLNGCVCVCVRACVRVCPRVRVSVSVSVHGIYTMRNL